jgi:hypothetical protein
MKPMQSSSKDNEVLNIGMVREMEKQIFHAFQRQKALPSRCRFGMWNKDKE